MGKSELHKKAFINAQYRWLPELNQTDSTPVYSLMADPYKKATIVMSIMVFIFMMLLALFHYLGALQKPMHLFYVVLCFFVISVIFAILAYDFQHTRNKSIKKFVKTSSSAGDTLTKYDYQMYKRVFD